MKKVFAPSRNQWFGVNVLLILKKFIQSELFAVEVTGTRRALLKALSHKVIK